jgi:hypothetical protein
VSAPEVINLKGYRWGRPEGAVYIDRSMPLYSPLLGPARDGLEVRELTERRQAARVRVEGGRCRGHRPAAVQKVLDGASDAAGVAVEVDDN